MVVPLPQSKPSSRDRASRNANAAQFFTDLQSELSAPDPRTPVAAPRSPVRRGSRPIAKLYNELTPLEQEARDKQGIETLKGLAVGIPAGILGLPADLAALIFRDAPQLAAKLVTGQELEVEERTFIDKLVGDFQRAAGAEAIIGYMGFGADLLPEEDEKGQPVNLATDAMSQAGVTPFRAGSLIGEVTAPIPTGAGIARLLGRRSKDVSEVLPAERVDPTISTTSDELGDIIEGSIVERLEGPRPPDEVMATPEEIAAFPPPPPPAPPRIENVNDVIDDGNGVFEFDVTGRAETAALTDDELVQRYIAAREEFTAGDNIVLDTEAGTRMRYIQNELLGRRDGHYGQTTQEDINAQILAENTRPVEESSDAPESLAVTDTGNNVIPEEGFEALPGGIGALDESMPVYGNYNLTIGGMPDEFKGSVTHYSPTMTNFQNFVGSRAFARQQDSDKKLEARQWLAALNKNPTNSQKVGSVGKEIRDSEFEKIMLSNPEKKYNQTEIRRLLTSRLPQTRVRTFLESKSNQEFQDGESPFSYLSYMDTQYNSADLNSARDKGVIIFSNTAPTIDVPGFGRLKPKAVHPYYDKYPGYYGHARFIVVEGADGKRYLQINEIQSNDVSDVSSGYRLGRGNYVKPLDKRLEAFKSRERILNGAGPTGEIEQYTDSPIRVPYSPEVHKIMKEVQDLKPEVIERSDVLQASLNENSRTLNDLRQDRSFLSLPEAQLEPSGFVGARFQYAPRAFNYFMQQPNMVLQALRDLPSISEYRDPIRTALADSLDAQGVAYPAEAIDSLLLPIENARDKTLAARLDMDAAPIPISNTIKIELTGEANPSVQELRSAIGRTAQSKEDLFKMYLRDQLLNDAEHSISNTQVKKYFSTDPDFLRQISELSDAERTDLFTVNTRADNPTELAQKQNAIVDKLYDEYPNRQALVDDLLEKQSTYVNEYGGEGSFELFSARNRNALSQEQLEEIFIKNTMGNMVRGSNGSELFEGLAIKNRIDELVTSNANLQTQVSDMAADVAAAQTGWNDALGNLPNAEQVATLMKVARITGEARRGFVAELPYSSDEDFYKFATRAAIKEAEKLDLDGVIFPDAAYLATQPDREINDAFMRNYGRVIDSELKELTKADENAGVRLRKVDITNNEDPFELIGRGQGFEVQGIDPSDLDVQEALQPFRTEVRNADRDYKQAKATVDDLERQGTDTADMADELEEERLMRTRLENVKATLETEMRRRSTTYNSELRVVEFDNDANKQLARRPIRRATGGMVRSGIGAMAREVM